MALEGSVIEASIPKTVSADEPFTSLKPNSTSKFHPHSSEDGNNKEYEEKKKESGSRISKSNKVALLFAVGGASSASNSVHSSASNLLSLMSKPSPTEIRRWMADTQQTVDKVVTSWQVGIIDKSLQVSHLLDELVQFITSLDCSPSDEHAHNTGLVENPPLLAVTFRNNSNAFESAVNIYLHVILMAVGQITGKVEADQRVRRRERQNLRDILSLFSHVAEDALKFLKTHEKLLVPVCSRVVAMRNELYSFLHSVLTQPTGQIIPIVRSVSLERIRMEEDTAWLERKHRSHVIDSQYPCSLSINVGAKNFAFVVDPNSNLAKKNASASSNNTIDEEGEVYLKYTSERVELVRLLLKELGISIGTSDKSCQSSQQLLSDICSRLYKKFNGLSRELDLERRECHLKAENCCVLLKTYLCQLEVKFHQVEKILEEIPEHLRRVIGVADQCSRQLTLCLDSDSISEDPGEWTSPIEEVSEGYFKKRTGLLGCIPFLWKLIAKVILGNSGSSQGTNKRLREFWEQVRSDLEDFQKELKTKEMEPGYSVTFNVPIDSGEQTAIKYLIQFTRTLENTIDIIQTDRGKHEASTDEIHPSNNEDRQQIITNFLEPKESFNFVRPSNSDIDHVISDKLKMTLASYSYCRHFVGYCFSVYHFAPTNLYSDLVIGEVSKVGSHLSTAKQIETKTNVRYQLKMVGGFIIAPS